MVLGRFFKGKEKRGRMLSKEEPAQRKKKTDIQKQRKNGGKEDICCSEKQSHIRTRNEKGWIILRNGLRSPD